MLYIGATSAILWWSTRTEETGKPAASGHASSKRWEWLALLWVTPRPLGHLFAAAFRFDYANWTAQTSESAPTIAVATVPVPTAGGLATGSIVPSWAAVLRVPFRRYYFGAALAAWMLANFILYALTSRGVLPDLGRVVYAACLSIISIPLVVAAVVGVAWVRGEGRQMWKYQEVWTAEPAAAEAAVAEKPAVTAEYEGNAEKIGALDLMEDSVKCVKLG